jgi:MarR family 2-MHQ and catechol resistance regulon transcriptional repressor
MSTEIDIDLKLFVVFSKAARAFADRKMADIAKYGLNPTEFAVLELLYHKGDVPMQQIGEKILITSGSITYVVDKLEKKQLLQRKPSATDRRISYAAITPAGTALMDELFPGHRTVIADMFSLFTDTEKQQLIDQLKRFGLSLTQP